MTSTGTPVPPAPAVPDLCGSVLDQRYELRALIGEGTFGRVYRALDRRLDRAVAVKLIKPWWADTPSWASAFEREARLLARLSDPGIVQIFDVGQAAEGLYYVAELVDGESLASRLQRGTLGPAEAADIAEQLCRALAAAHAQNVVHRDIKPANVLLSADSSQVKLGDFGLARLVEEATDGSASALVAGTPRYMAPERAQGLPTTPASDVYSVGVVIYEMLAGVPPFTGTSPMALALSHLHEAPPALPSATPPGLKRVVVRALSKAPEERYRDAGEMATAVAHARSSGMPDPTLVAPVFSPRRVFNPAGRRQMLASFAVVLAVLVAMALGSILLSSPDRVRVPRFRGLTKAAVAREARRLHLRLSFANRYDSARPGTAIGQSPGAGARINDGSTVRVVLSAGPPPVKVPQLVGQGSTSATSILSSLGLSARVTSVPAPGTRPGTVTAQAPSAGSYVRSHGRIALSVAETPRWRQVTSFAGTNAGSSVPFRIRGRQWRVIYRMHYDGTCTFIIFCNGPSAQVLRMSDGTTPASFSLNEGDNQTRVVLAGPGLYEIKIQPGNDSASWSVEVDDYY